MGDAPPEKGDGVEQIRIDGFMGAFPSFPIKKTAKANLVILVVFLVDLGL